MGIFELEKQLGYQFQAPELLKRALTHPSLGENNYQRLEFLGDAVLELFVSRMLYDKRPLMPEGEMTRLRSALVREETLATVAREMNLGRYLSMDPSLSQEGGRNYSSILCDALEAVLAAVYLDGGSEAAQALVQTYWGKLLSQPIQSKDAKSALQEMLQAKGQSPPDYQLVDQIGPAHRRIFEMAVFIDGKEAARAKDISKKKAEQAAAKLALEQICKGNA